MLACGGHKHAQRRDNFSSCVHRPIAVVSRLRRSHAVNCISNLKAVGGNLWAIRRLLAYTVQCKVHDAALLLPRLLRVQMLRPASVGWTAGLLCVAVHSAVVAQR